MADRDQHDRAQRVPPHNIDAEEAVIGAALLSSDALAEVVALASSDFYKPQNAAIFHALRQVHLDGVQVDQITVAEQLRRDGADVDEIGGVVRLNELLNAAPSTSGVGWYVRIVRETADRRRMIQAGGNLTDAGFDESTDVADALTATSSAVVELAARRSGEGAAWSASTLEWLDPADVLGGLEPEEPVILARSDGACLFYAGKMHSVQAESTTGKTWLVLVGCLQVVDMGGSVVYVDYEDTGRGIIRRCQELGATIDDAFLSAFRYVSAPGKFGADEMADMAAKLDELNPDLVVIDGVGESMARAGLSEDSAPEYLQWLDMLPRAITRKGPGVVMIDHVKKDPDTRGRYARGTGAKLGALDGAAYNMVNRVPFSRHKSGYSDVVVDKDRPGAVGAIRETVARVHFEPHAGGERLVVRVDPYTAELSPTDTWRPTILMEKVSRAIEESPVEMPASTVKAMVHAGNPAHLKEAMARLLAEGFVEETGRRKKLRSVKPFRAAWEKGPGAAGEPPPEAVDDPRLFAVSEPEPEHATEERMEAFDALWQDPPENH